MMCLAARARRAGEATSSSASGSPRAGSSTSGLRPEADRLMHDRPHPFSAYRDVPADNYAPAPAHAPTPNEIGAPRGNRPRILVEMQMRLDAYLDDPSRHLPTLNAANESVRQQRLERRTACVQLLRALLKYLDLVSLRVGIPQRDGGFLNMTLPKTPACRCAGLRARCAISCVPDSLAPSNVPSAPKMAAFEAWHRCASCRPPYSARSIFPNGCAMDAARP